MPTPAKFDFASSLPYTAEAAAAHDAWVLRELAFVSKWAAAAPALGKALDRAKAALQPGSTG